MEKANYRANIELIKEKYPDEVLLSIQQTAKFLNLNIRTVYRLIQRGELKCVKVGNNTKRVAVAELANWLS